MSFSGRWYHCERCEALSNFPWFVYGIRLPNDFGFVSLTQHINSASQRQMVGHINIAWMHMQMSEARTMNRWSHKTKVLDKDCPISKGINNQKCLKQLQKQVQRSWLILIVLANLLWRMLAELLVGRSSMVLTWWWKFDFKVDHENEAYKFLNNRNPFKSQKQRLR